MAVVRGDIRWADLDPVVGHEQGGRRPVVVLSRDDFNAHGTVIAMAVTSAPQRAGYPLTWPVPAGRTPQPSWVKVGQVRTLAADRLGKPVGRLEETELRALWEALGTIVGFPPRLA